MRLYRANGYVVLIGIVFLFLGAASILYSLTNYRDYHEKINTYNQAYGTIMDVYKQRQYIDKSNMEELTICEFRYIVEDKLYVNKNIVNKNQFEVGDNITVYYIDNKPEEGFIMPDNLMLYAIVGILGLVFFGSGVGIIWIGLSAKEVIVFQQNNFETNMNNIENLEWNNKLKEIRQREINNNQRVLSSFQQTKKSQNDLFNDLNEINIVENDYYNNCEYDYY